jgi:hypothetical protein
MNDKPIKQISKIGPLRYTCLFLGGLGICFLFVFPGLHLTLKEKESEYQKELNSLKLASEKKIQ